MEFFYIVEVIAFVVFAINIVYLLFFSAASLYKKKVEVGIVSDEKKIAVLIPAYKEDTVIFECVESCLHQKYPIGKYDIVVISDRMKEETNQKLMSLSVKLVKVVFENSTKAKALNFAMDTIGDQYDIAVVLDADNVVDENFLRDINAAFVSKDIQLLQLHRTAKNTNTSLAILDAVSEEINNSIFRLGHTNVGLSAALIGSGMAFDYSLFKKIMLSIDAVGGFDRALELTFLHAGKKIHYLHDVYVWDEKVQFHSDFSRQRRRWLSAQLHYLDKFLPNVGPALLKGNWDFCDKLFQQMSIPRLILLGTTFIMAVSFSFFNEAIALRWWILCFLLWLALFIATPRSLLNRKLLVAMFQLPYSFLLMSANLFRLKNANKKFIHTSHGIKDKKEK